MALAVAAVIGQGSVAVWTAVAVAAAIGPGSVVIWTVVAVAAVNRLGSVVIWMAVAEKVKLPSFWVKEWRFWQFESFCCPAPPTEPYLDLSIPRGSKRRPVRL